MPLAELLASFQSLPQLPISKLGPSGADSQVCGFLYILGPCGSLQWSLLWGWECPHLPQPPQVSVTRGFEAYFPLEHGVVRSVSSPVVPPSLSACKFGTAQSTSCRLAMSPLCFGCPFLALLQVWINVSSLTPWLSDFHTVWFSGSSGYFFLFLNLLLSFFWLWVYLPMSLSWPEVLQTPIFKSNSLNYRFYFCLYLTSQS